jgi:hypothetical protein
MAAPNPASVQVINTISQKDLRLLLRMDSHIKKPGCG